jgi:hypothetical protein
MRELHGYHGEHRRHAHDATAATDTPGRHAHDRTHDAPNFKVLLDPGIFSRGAERTCGAFSRFACWWPWLLSAVGATGVVERRTEQPGGSVSGGG